MNQSYCNGHLVAREFADVEHTDIQEQVLPFDAQEGTFKVRGFVEIERSHSCRIVQNRVGKRAHLGFLQEDGGVFWCRGDNGGDSVAALFEQLVTSCLQVVELRLTPE